MNKKFKKITAILMSALIISSVTALTACTDTSDENKSTATEPKTESSTELTTVVNFDDMTKETQEIQLDDSDGIYVQGAFPEDAMISANFSRGYIEHTTPLFTGQYWYRSWFGVNNEAPKFIQREFYVEASSADSEYLPVKMKVFVPYDKPDCHIVYYDHKHNLKEIPAEYIDGEYVFSIDPDDFEYNNIIYNFYICTYGEPADPNAKPVQQTLTDKETGITVSGKIPPDTQLMVLDYSNNHTLGSNKVTTPELYYITLVRGYKEITPSDSLTVTIPGKKGNKVGYYHPDKFNNSVMTAVGKYKPEMVDVNKEYIPVVDKKDTQKELTYLESKYNNNSYTINTNKLGMFGIGKEDNLKPEYLCRVDQYAPN